MNPRLLAPMGRPGRADGERARWGGAWYAFVMSAPINLADPECEPSDAQLVELSTRAFAGVRLSQVERLRRLRAEIEVARMRALQRLDDVEGPPAKP